MTQYRNEFNVRNPMTLIIGIILSILVLYGLFRLASFVFNLLFYLSPIVLIATLVVDYKVVTGYVSWIVDLFKRNLPFGIVMGLVTVFAFPVVCVFLLSRALFKRQIKKATEQAEQDGTTKRGEYIQFEEIESRTIEIPKKEKEPEKRTDDKGSDYEQFFD